MHEHAEIHAQLVDRLMQHLADTWGETGDIHEVLRLVRIRFESISSIKLLRAMQPDEEL